MKKIFYNSLLAILLTGSFSCSDFIDKAPLDQVAAGKFFKDEQNAEAAVTGIYRSVESPYFDGQYGIIIPEYAAGHLRHTASYPEFVEYLQNRIRVDNPWSENLWTAMYATINAANFVIQNVPGIENSTDDKKQQFIREAKFLRALTYFNIVRSWGDAPLVLTPIATTNNSELQVPRATAAQIYGQIIDDLNDAVNLPTAYASTEQNKGRATSYAAKALLAKVYLYTGNNQASASVAKDVIDNGGYTLTQDYPSIWLSENSSESIFELQFDQQSTNALVQSTTWNGTTLFFASGKSDSLFEAGDVRENFTIYKANNNLYIGKYRNDNPATQNMTLIRLSETYLIYAEAQARIAGSAAGDHFQYYKAIRDRAGLITPDPSTFTLQEFLNAIQREKRVELMFEGEAWYDYTRTGLALTEMMKVPDPGRFLFPIPQLERNLDPQLTQNPVYN